jgi:hypothetical protein
MDAGQGFSHLSGWRACDYFCLYICALTSIQVQVGLVPLNRKLARSQRWGWLGLKQEAEGLKEEVACGHLFLFFPVLKLQHGQTLQAGFLKRQGACCPRKQELIPWIKTASCCTTFSRLPPDTQMLLVWKFISTGGFKAGPRHCHISCVMLQLFLDACLFTQMKSWRSQSEARWYFLW